VAEKKPLEVGDVKPPKQLLELEHLYTRDNTTYCVRPSCDGCPYDSVCSREEMIIKIGPGINIRQAFRARPGYKWACIDFAGIELRVAALLSGEPVWVQAFQEDQDLHSSMGCIMFKVDEPDKAQRDIAKMGNFGNLYLSSVKTFWHLTTLTFNEAAIAWKKWWDAVPVYKKWTENQEEYYKKHGHVWTFFRRKREMRAMIARADGNIGKTKGKKTSGKKVGHGFCHRTACNCLADGTYITTTHRMTTIGEIHRTGVLPDERIWNGVSSEEFITHDAGYKEVWRIKFESGVEITASSEHLFKVYREKTRISSWIPTSGLEIGVRVLADQGRGDLVFLDEGRYGSDVVVSVQKKDFMIPMKDIEVLTGRPEFMANGVLVHNSPIQGTSADLLKMAMTRVDDFLTKEKLRDDVKMMLTVHDELDFEIRDNSAMYEILREIGRQMTLTPKGKVLPTIPNWNIPLKVDIEIGDNWGNLIGIDDLDPITKDLPKPEKSPPKRDEVTLLVSGITMEDANKLHMAIFRAANEPNVVKVPLLIKMGDRAYSLKALNKVSEGHLRRFVQGIPGVKIL
jgi:hypothetical protein